MEEVSADVVFLQETGLNSEKYQTEQYHFREEAEILQIFTKHKILRENHWESGGFWFGKSADIEVNGKVIRFYNIYLQPFYFNKELVKPTGDRNVDETKYKSMVLKMKETFKDHQIQINQIQKDIENCPYLVIAGGDLNSVPNSYEYYALRKNLTDSFEKTGKGSGTSFHDYKFPIRIDYLFSSKTIDPISCEVNRNVKLSDHFPVIATFKTH